MTIITDSASADLHARRADGATYRKIAEAVGLKQITVYQHLRRRGGLTSMPPAVVAERRAAANDNNPDRVTRMAAHNGGCSTLSGMMPVSLARVPTIDGAGGDDIGAARVGVEPIQIGIDVGLKVAA